MSSSTQPPPTPEVPAPSTPLERMLQEMRTGKRGQGSLFGMSVSSALEAVWANRMRSLLTMLGIVIGIGAVIGSLIMTSGVGAYLDDVIAGQGATTVDVYGSVFSDRGVRTSQKHPSLTNRDLAMLKQLPHVSGVSPWIQTRRQVVFGNQNWNTSVIGVSSDIQSIQSWDVADGVWFTQAQDSGGEAVALIGDTIRQKLFSSGIDPVGQQIRMGPDLFRIVGVLSPRGMGAFGVSDDSILIPYRAAQTRLLNQLYYNEFYVSADTIQNVDLVSQEVTQMLEQNHRIGQNQPDDFQLQTTTQLKAQEDQGTAAIAALFAGIAAISLTIGGIGIMNIMLVSVTERTREIGIRMAMGARRRDIRYQFLAEALFLCLVGAVLGLLLGLFIGWLMAGVVVNAFINASGSGGSGGGTTIPLIITPTIILMPVIVSLAIGLVFGLYPAIRASHLDPIAAIRRAK
ncbi:MAG TPA: ABC transporter permease [Ktedonosporobacter sp.]|nr:ABC transporter permease [Ktedonosporobacter sp.]